MGIVVHADCVPTFFSQSFGDPIDALTIDPIVQITYSTAGSHLYGALRIVITVLNHRKLYIVNETILQTLILHINIVGKLPMCQGKEFSL